MSRFLHSSPRSPLTTITKSPGPAVLYDLRSKLVAEIPDSPLRETQRAPRWQDADVTAAGDLIVLSTPDWVGTREVQPALGRDMRAWLAEHVVERIELEP